MKRVIVALLIVLFFPFVFANENISQQEIAKNCLDGIDIVLNELEQANISLVRFEDVYTRASNLYDAQMILLESSKKTDFSNVISSCEQIVSLKQTAFDAYDYYRVFLSFYDETLSDNMDTSSVDEIVEEIKEEFKGERYENVLPLIDDGYKQISIVKSEQTAVLLAYQNTRKKIVDVVSDNWLEILIGVAILLALYLFYRNKVSLWILQRKLRALEMRKDSLKNLLSGAQRDYFQNGKISENDYRIRVKNFSELVRDIERQIPLLQQDIARYSSRQKKTTEGRVERKLATVRMVESHNKEVVKVAPKVVSKKQKKKVAEKKVKTKKKVVKKRKK